MTSIASINRKSNVIGTVPLNDDIHSISLYCSKHYLLHYNIGPFIILYLIWFLLWAFHFGLGEYPELGMIITVIIAILQVVTCLFCYWFVPFRAWMQCLPEKSPWKAEVVVVQPTANNGYPEMVPLHHGKNPHDQTEQAWFTFQKCRYIYEEAEKKTFKTIDYPLSNSFHSYLQSKGYQTQEEIEQGAWSFGLNKMNIEIPKFIDLFIERATAPFFVFQVFCVLLWCLDEYWYYSLLTLFMLVIFEITLVQQQKRNMAMIRQMGNQPYKINVFRQKKWIKIDTTDILPGDICSVLRSNDNNPLPCDMLLLRGQCIVDESMLTGESIPQMKEPIDVAEEQTILDLERHSKLHILSAGTKIVQHTPPAKLQGSMKAADNGCIAYALRTGFSTSQGKLLKTILYSVKRVTANNLETFLFILFLLVFAIIAASYVWIEGTKDPKRNRYKLFIECTLILTSVVPPELPIELSLAVNTSLIALVKLLIYCTEPFRIPFAGKVDICCFDKTGTLTSDDLVVEGVAGIQGSDDPIPLAQIEVTSPVKQVLLTCHALANLDGDIIGDPLEKATLTALDWTVTRGDTVVPNKGRGGRWQIHQRFHFLSALKRMSVIAGQNVSPSNNDTTYIVAVKGAPETLKSMFRSIPERYDEIYLRLSRQGARVLALGHRSLGVLTNQELRERYPARETIECDLDFCGFVILSCPLKPDSKARIRELRYSSHHLTMITGDNPLTACHVAKELEFTAKPILVLTENKSSGHESPEKESTAWHWESVNKDIILPLNVENFYQTTRKYDLCVTGEGLTHLTTLPVKYLNILIPHIKVFARVSPKQKEQVIIKFNSLGFVTLMCGDGTNDVAALKHAHAGVALLSGIAAKKAEQQQQQKQETSAVVPPSIAAPVPPQNLTSAEAANRAREQARQRLDELYRQMDEGEQTIVRLGDASIAAPFTSRTSTIECVCHIIKQGRCTLITTLQMFKILALNALILAYSLSVLYLDGIKFSDGQHTLQGLLLAGCFLFISRSKPLKTLARERPLPNIFNLYTLLSVLGQFAVHLTALIYVVNEAHKRIPPRSEEFVNLEAEFSPNLINSTVYIMSVTLQIATFAVNYQGYPFMESLRSNKPLLYSIVFAFTLVTSLIFNILPQLTEQFQIVIIPDDMRSIVFSVVLADVILAYIIDRVLAFFLGQAKLKQY